MQRNMLINNELNIPQSEPGMQISPYNELKISFSYLKTKNDIEKDLRQFFT